MNITGKSTTPTTGWNPTPEEIAIECSRIRETWSELDWIHCSNTPTDGYGQVRPVEIQVVKVNR